MRATSFIVLGVLTLGAAIGSGRSAGAQRPPLPPLPPLRPLGPIFARSAVPVGNARAARALPDGGVLVYDAGSRRVLLVGAGLANATVVVDSSPMPPRPQAFGGALLPMCGDSSLYLDGVASAAIVLDGSARVVRRIALSPEWLGTSGVLTPPARAFADCAARVVYREPAPIYLAMVPATFRGDTIVKGPDSLALLRFDLATHRIDTAIVVRAPRVRQALTRFERGGRGRPAEDPLAGAGDAWVMLSDATIAVIRSTDYHVEWLRGASLTSGPRVAHEWTPITRPQKVALVDSLRMARDAARADSLYPLDSARYDSLALVAAANPDALLGPDGKRTALGPRPVRLQFVAPTDLPDSLPPFTSSDTFADADGDIWVRAWPASVASGGERYDVLDRGGVLVDRVELPAGAALLGVARDAAILRLPSPKGATLAKARLR